MKDESNDSDYTPQSGNDGTATSKFHSTHVLIDGDIFPTTQMEPEQLQSIHWGDPKNCDNNEHTLSNSSGERSENVIYDFVNDDKQFNPDGSVVIGVNNSQSQSKVCNLTEFPPDSDHFSRKIIKHDKEATVQSEKEFSCSDQVRSFPSDLRRRKIQWLDQKDSNQISFFRHAPLFLMPNLKWHWDSVISICRKKNFVMEDLDSIAQLQGSDVNCGDSEETKEILIGKRRKILCRIVSHLTCPLSKINSETNKDMLNLIGSHSLNALNSYRPQEMFVSVRNNDGKLYFQSKWQRPSVHVRDWKMKPQAYPIHPIPLHNNATVSNKHIDSKSVVGLNSETNSEMLSASKDLTSISPFSAPIYPMIHPLREPITQSPALSGIEISIPGKLVQFSSSFLTLEKKQPSKSSNLPVFSDESAKTELDDNSLMIPFIRLDEVSNEPLCIPVTLYKI